MKKLAVPGPFFEKKIKFPAFSKPSDFHLIDGKLAAEAWLESLCANSSTSVVADSASFFYDTKLNKKFIEETAQSMLPKDLPRLFIIKF
jgi:hypothetical protein